MKTLKYMFVCAIMSIALASSHCFAGWFDWFWSDNSDAKAPRPPAQGLVLVSETGDAFFELEYAADIPGDASKSNIYQDERGGHWIVRRDADFPQQKAQRAIITAHLAKLFFGCDAAQALEHRIVLDEGVFVGFAARYLADFKSGRRRCASEYHCSIYGVHYPQLRGREAVDVFARWIQYSVRSLPDGKILENMGILENTLLLVDFENSFHCDRLDPFNAYPMDFMVNRGEWHAQMQRLSDLSSGAIRGALAAAAAQLRAGGVTFFQSDQADYLNRILASQQELRKWLERRKALALDDAAMIAAPKPCCLDTEILAYALQGMPIPQTCEQGAQLAHEDLESFLKIEYREHWAAYSQCGNAVYRDFEGRTWPLLNSLFQGSDEIKCKNTGYAYGAVENGVRAPYMLLLAIKYACEDEADLMLSAYASEIDFDATCKWKWCNDADRSDAYLIAEQMAQARGKTALADKIRAVAHRLQTEEQESL